MFDHQKTDAMYYPFDNTQYPFFIIIWFKLMAWGL